MEFMERVKSMKENNFYENDLISHSFIIKIWQEETIQESSKVSWRGHISHVISGRKRYIQSLDDINLFIIPYLKEMGAKP